MKLNMLVVQLEFDYQKSMLIQFPRHCRRNENNFPAKFTVVRVKCRFVVHELLGSVKLILHFQPAENNKAEVVSRTPCINYLFCSKRGTE